MPHVFEASKLRLPSPELDRILSQHQSFVVVAQLKMGKSIALFLANENKYRLSTKRLKDRVKYVWGGRHGFLAVDIVTIWNNAKMKGYEISFSKESDDSYQFLFNFKQ